jgi:hypothetical protein
MPYLFLDIRKVNYECRGNQMVHDAEVIKCFFHEYIPSVFDNAVCGADETAEMWIWNEDEPEEYCVMGR